MPHGPVYDADEYHAQRQELYGGWGLVASQVFGIAHYQPPPQSGRPLCAETDPEVFFPEKGGCWDAQLAKRICRRCPIVDECLEGALDRREEYGIWGGTTERQRRALSKRREAV